MNAEILCIGTELLHGDIVNTNAQYISKKLAEIGIDIYNQTVVGDNPDRIKNSFDIAFSRSDIVICTGGLGPTKDDITKNILADFFDVEMIYDEASLDHVKQIYSRFNRDMPENNIRQAYFPKGSKILNNPNGTANACILREKTKNGEYKIGILLPGPPKEMQPLVCNEVIPYLQQFSKEVVYGEKIIVTNIGESKAEEMIMDIIDNQTNPTVAPYASAGKVLFRITAKSTSKEDCIKLISPVKEELLKRFGENAYISDSGQVEEITAKLLIKNNLTISIAESLTGGMVSSRLIGFPGISKVFKEGFITYSNESKINILNVKESTLKQYGAVSEETAKEMAIGAALLSNSNIGASTTGIAGPDGGSENKPVGLCYVCVYFNNNFNVLKINAVGTRDTIRERASTALLDLIRKTISQ